MFTTQRLQLRNLNEGDAAFILTLLNDEGFIANIGDRQVRTTEDAVRYIEDGPWSHYQKPGFGQLLVIDKNSEAKMGLCGLLQRDFLDCPDIGFAFLPAFRANGYAKEAASGIIDFAKQHTRISQIAGIVSPDNGKSISLLKRLGMDYVRDLREDEMPSPTRLYKGDYI